MGIKGNNTPRGRWPRSPTGRWCRKGQKKGVKRAQNGVILVQFGDGRPQKGPNMAPLARALTLFLADSVSTPSSPARAHNIRGVYIPLFTSNYGAPRHPPRWVTSQEGGDQVPGHPAGDREHGMENNRGTQRHALHAAVYLSTCRDGAAQAHHPCTWRWCGTTLPDPKTSRPHPHPTPPLSCCCCTAAGACAACLHPQGVRPQGGSVATEHSDYVERYSTSVCNTEGDEGTQGTSACVACVPSSLRSNTQCNGVAIACKGAQHAIAT